MDIVNIAKELGGEDFSDMIQDDIREHIEGCGEPFTSEEFEEVMQSPTGSDDDVMEDTEAQTPSDWTLQKDMIVEYDPSMERGIMVTRGMTTSLKPLQHLFNEAKKRERQLPITMFLNKAPAAAEPIILRREVSLPTSSRNPRTGRSPGDLRPPTETVTKVPPSAGIKRPDCRIRYTSVSLSGHFCQDLWHLCQLENFHYFKVACKHFPRKSKIYVHSSEHPENRTKYVPKSLQTA
ncbi:hypothetical protein M514_21022 [Trichuris suis]|uniref:Uncharacterized protein n=1 Tax=Trichuris suis TaxID=68888 RepID=A0A085NBN2_9BILA|nr:hypothetical protein M514_21022 [Trichuris suis]